MNWQNRIRQAATLPIDDDVVEELAQHAAATYASARAEGCDETEAERRVEQQIRAWAADPAVLQRRPRRPPAVIPPAGPGRGLASVAQDVRYGWRLLRRQPGYAAVLIATMALGISATTILGSVAYGVLLKPLPWADAPRLVRLYESRQGGTRRLLPLMTNATYNEWRKLPATLDAIGAWSTSQMTVGGDGRAERIRIAEITPSLLAILQTTPALGRGLVEGDEEPGSPPVVLLSHGLWQQRFGGRPDIAGQTIRLNTTIFTIVGVMPPGFAFPDTATRAWTPFFIRPVITPGSKGFTFSMFQAIGRLRSGVTPAQAAAEGTARGRLAPPHTPVAMAAFGSDGPVEVTAVPLLEALTADVRPAILILLIAVCLLLVTATANAASLQLARASARRRELAIRAALGAGRSRLVRQTLVENLLLGLLGGIAGLALAALMHRALPVLLPADFPRVADLAFDIRIKLFAVAVSVAAGLGCGLLSAWHVGRTDLVPALVEDSLAPVGGGLRARTARIRAVIMTAQVAIASVLLVGALLLSRSFLSMLHADVGYDAANVLTARLILGDGEFSPERRLQTLEQVVARLRAVPGITGAAYATGTPFGNTISLSSFPLRKHDGTTPMVQSGSRSISPGYFAALGQRVVEGREFTVADTGTAEDLLIVNREFARRYLDGRAVGWTLPPDRSEAEARPARERRIIGVVDDTARQSVTDTPAPEMFFMAHQEPIGESTIALIVRTAGDPRLMVGSFRAAVETTAPGAPLEGVMTMEDKAAATLSRPRLYAVLLGAFAAFALAIAGVGLFGVLSYTVAQRAREIGVRSALGAQVRDIVGLVVRQSMVIAAAGVAIGLLASVWLTRALQTFLFGVTPHDFPSYAAVAIVLIAVAAIASIVPARRAAHVDPVKALRG